MDSKPSQQSSVTTALSHVRKDRASGMGGEYYRATSVTSKKEPTPPPAGRPRVLSGKPGSGGLGTGNARGASSSISTSKGTLVGTGSGMYRGAGQSRNAMLNNHARGSSQAPSNGAKLQYGSNGTSSLMRDTSSSVAKVAANRAQRRETSVSHPKHYNMTHSVKPSTPSLHAPPRSSLPRHHPAVPNLKRNGSGGPFAPQTPDVQQRPSGSGPLSGPRSGAHRGSGSGGSGGAATSAAPPAATPAPISSGPSNTDLFYQILSQKAAKQVPSAAVSAAPARMSKPSAPPAAMSHHHGAPVSMSRTPRNSNTHPPPPTKHRREAGHKYVYDLAKEQWVTFDVMLDIDETPFDQGTMRWCFKATEYSRSGERFPSVVKVYKDLRDGPRAYFSEAVTQMIAESYAQKFNASSSLHKVAILPIAVCRISQPLSGSYFCTIEPFLQGEYVKHSDNVGTVATSDPVPQAFSHFTYEVSSHLLVVCDIQGVGNFYTDPQIHSLDGKGFGLGNLGQQGINRFLESHNCNAVCRGLKLPSVYGRSSSSGLIRVAYGRLGSGGAGDRGGERSGTPSRVGRGRGRAWGSGGGDIGGGGGGG